MPAEGFQYLAIDEQRIKRAPRLFQVASATKRDG